MEQNSETKGPNDPQESKGKDDRGSEGALKLADTQQRKGGPNDQVQKHVADKNLSSEGTKVSKSQKKKKSQGLGGAEGLVEKDVEESPANPQGSKSVPKRKQRRRNKKKSDSIGSTGTEGPKLENGNRSVSDIRSSEGQNNTKEIDSNANETSEGGENNNAKRSKGRRRRGKGLKSRELDPSQNHKQEGNTEMDDGQSLNQRKSIQQQKNQNHPNSRITNAKTSKNKRMFASHYTEEEVKKGIEEKALFRGEIRVNSRNYKQAFINNPFNPTSRDVLIKEVENRNRAMHGDLVVVEILPEQEWVVLHDTITEYLKGKNENSEDITLKKAAISVKDQKDSQELPKKGEKSLIRLNQTRTQGNDDVVVESVQEIPNLNINDMEEIIKKVTEIDVSRQEGTFKPDFNETPSPSKTEEIGKNSGNETLEKNDKINKKKGNQGKNVAKAKKSDEQTVLKNEETAKPKYPLPLDKPHQDKTPNPDIQYKYKDVKEHSKWERFIQRTAKVVYIEEKRHLRKGAGYLSIFPDKRTDFAKFRALDSGIPDLRIPKDKCPDKFFLRPQDFQNMLFVAQLEKWEYIAAAEGTILNTLGDEDNIDVQSEALLIDLVNEDFSNGAKACLPSLPFSIPLDEIERRRDFRGDCVFTIDPMTARDLDDALSVTNLGNDLFKIAVHIADVSYFVKENTDLDKEAFKRATSVYLVQKVRPMLPRTLCEDLCSLNPDVDRLTYSVEWTLNSEGEILSEWFGKTIIKSCCKLAYEHAQSMLDLPTKDWKEDELPQVSDPWTPKDLSERVHILNTLAKKLRQNREEKGAIRLDLPKLCFALNHETGEPMGYNLYEHKHSNKLIEEFMLLANMSVAKKIYTSFPDLALLRNHKPPKENMTQELQEFMEKHDVELDFENSKTLRESLAKVIDKANSVHSKAKADVIINRTSKTMELATYLCSGTFSKEERKEKLHHYALCVPLYTHFTSPIRRYPDIIVHRLLDAAVQGKKIFKLRVQDVDCLAIHCNEMKLRAKQAGEKSTDLYLAQLIKNCGSINVPGVVIEVKKGYALVLIYGMAIIRRMYFDKLQSKLVRNARYFVDDDGKPEVKLEWKPDGENEPKIVEHLRTFTHVNITLHPSDTKPFEYYGVIQRTRNSAAPRRNLNGTKNGCYKK